MILKCIFCTGFHFVGVFFVSFLRFLRSFVLHGVCCPKTLHWEGTPLAGTAPGRRDRGMRRGHRTPNCGLRPWNGARTLGSPGKRTM